MTIAKAISRAWSDTSYKARLVQDPHTALTEVGVEAPAGTAIRVVEDTATTRHLVLPVAPSNAGELSSEELEKVAGGLTGDGGAGGAGGSGGILFGSGGAGGAGGAP